MSPKKRWWVKKIGKGWWIGHEHFALGNSFSTWERAYAEAVRRTRMVEVELSTEYGALVSGFPTALADWQDWAEEPVNAMEWFSDRDEQDDFGTHREDEGYEVEYFTRLVTNPIKDEMEHIQ